MTKEAIREIVQFDWETFKGERIYCMHNQEMPEFHDTDDAAEKSSPLQRKYTEALSAEDRYLENTMENIISNLGDKELFQAITALSDEQKALVYQIAVMLKKPSEIADSGGISRSAVTQKMQRIRKKSKKVSTDR